MVPSSCGLIFVQPFTIKQVFADKKPKCTTSEIKNYTSGGQPWLRGPDYLLYVYNYATTPLVTRPTSLPRMLIDVPLSATTWSGREIKEFAIGIVQLHSQVLTLTKSPATNGSASAASPGFQ